MLNNKSLLLISFIVLLTSCSTVEAPQGSVPKRNALMTDAFGGWIELKFYSPEDFTAGEFIAVDYDSLYVMKNSEVQKYAIHDISTARVILFKTESSAYEGWTFLGSLLTISNGYYLFFTFPITLITGATISSWEAKRKNFLDYPYYSFEQLKKYARFPQGIPKEINTATLKPRQNSGN